MNHWPAITAAIGIAWVVFATVVIRAQERRAARFLAERDGR